MKVESRFLAIVLLSVMWAVSIPIMFYTAEPSLLNLFSAMVFYIGIFLMFGGLFFLIVENPALEIPTSVVNIFTSKPKYEVKDAKLLVPKAVVKKE